MTSSPVISSSGTPIGILFLGHGTRLAAGVAECLSFTNRVEAELEARLRPLHIELRVQTAFLELQPPDLLSAVRTFARVGCRDVIIYPLFLFEAGHMKIDIPKLVSEAQLTYPEVSLHMHSHAIGSSNDVIRAATDPLVRIGAHSSQGSKTGVLFVGRGSKDATAYQTFHDVANRIAEEQRIPTSQYTCAFLAGMGSRFEQGLTTLHAAGNERLIVVPYLLFQGLLTNALPGQVTSWRGENVSRQQIEIVITRHLGVHSCVKEHVVGTVVGAVVEHLQYSFRA